MPRRPATARTPNRSDLTAAPDQGYGVAGAQLAAQRAVPMGPQPLGGPAAPPPGGPAPDVNAMAQAHNGPGDSMLLSRPTERPNEPVTHGLPVGPGAGPEALQGVGAATRDATVEQGTLTHLLASMASQPNATSAIKDLASRAAGGAM